MVVGVHGAPPQKWLARGTGYHPGRVTVEACPEDPACVSLLVGYREASARACGPASRSRPLWVGQLPPASQGLIEVDEGGEAVEAGPGEGVLGGKELLL